MKKTAFFLLFLVVVGTTSFAQGPSRQTIQYEYATIKDIKYREANDVAYNNSRCMLDIYYPTNKENYQTFIWFHGGGLTGGNREIPEALKDKGFAVIGVGYRLSPEVTVAECIDDAAAAAAWIVKNIKNYGGDPQKIFVSGHSAGGYLTSMIGLDKKYMAKYGYDPDEVFAALIPFSGQAITHFTRRSEIGMTQKDPLIDEMAPLYHVRPGNVPIIILSGDREREMTGRYEENAYFWRMLKIAGRENVEIYEFDGFDHNSMLVPGFQIAIRYLQQQERGARTQGMSPAR